MSLQKSIILPTDLLICSLACLIYHSVTQSLLHSFNHSFIHSMIPSFLIMHLIIPSFVQSFHHSFNHSIIQLVHDNVFQTSKESRWNWPSLRKERTRTRRQIQQWLPTRWTGPEHGTNVALYLKIYDKTIDTIDVIFHWCACVDKTRSSQIPDS